MSKYYYRDVLGQRIWYRHIDGEFYQGLVKKLREEIEWKKSSTSGQSSLTSTITHYVEFDNGNKGWFDLVELERDDGIRWSDPSVGAASKKRKKQTVEDDVPDEDKGGKKKPAEVHVDISSSEEEKDAAKGAKKQQDLSTDDSGGKSSSSSDESEHQFSSIRNESAKNWIRKLNLLNSYGTGEDGMKSINEATYVPPGSFELIFYLADYLFPGNEYHRRLFESDSRPGNKVRVELRKIKKKNKDDPLVSWHKGSKDSQQKWIPPTKQVLIGFIDLIRNQKVKESKKRQRAEI